LPGHFEQPLALGAVIFGPRANFFYRADDSPAPPRRELTHGVYLYRQGVLVMGRNTSIQGDAHG
jgi:hypothetical protein